MQMHSWLHQFPAQKFKKNTYLYRQGDPLELCYFLTSGICSQIITYENGEEITARYYFAGDMLSIWGMFKHRESYPGSMLCKTDVYAVVVPCKLVQQMLETSFDFYRWAAENAMQNNNYIYEQYQKKAKGNASEILCYTIYVLLQRKDSGEYYLARNFTIEELARHLRLHRVTVSRIFRVLQNENILRKFEDGWIVGDLDRLHLLSTGEDNIKY